MLANSAKLYSLNISLIDSGFKLVTDVRQSNRHGRSVLFLLNADFNTLDGKYLSERNTSFAASRTARAKAGPYVASHRAPFRCLSRGEHCRSRARSSRGIHPPLPLAIVYSGKYSRLAGFLDEGNRGQYQHASSVHILIWNAYCVTKPCRDAKISMSLGVSLSVICDNDRLCMSVGETFSNGGAGKLFEHFPLQAHR